MVALVFWTWLLIITGAWVISGAEWLGFVAVAMICVRVTMQCVYVLTLAYADLRMKARAGYRQPSNAARYADNALDITFLLAFGWLSYQGDVYAVPALIAFVTSIALYEVVTLIVESKS